MSHRGRYVSGAFYLGGVMTGYRTCVESGKREVQTLSTVVSYISCSVRYENVVVHQD